MKDHMFSVYGLPVHGSRFDKTGFQCVVSDRAGDYLSICLLGARTLLRLPRLYKTE